MVIQDAFGFNGKFLYFGCLAEKPCMTNPRHNAEAANRGMSFDREVRQEPNIEVRCHFA